MGAQDDGRTLFQQVADGGQSAADADVIGDLAVVIQRHVEIAAKENFLSGNVDVPHGLLMIIHTLVLAFSFCSVVDWFLGRFTPYQSDYSIQTARLQVKKAIKQPNSRRFSSFFRRSQQNGAVGGGADLLSPDQLSLFLQAGKVPLAQHLVHHHRHGVGQVQAPGAGPHGDADGPLRVALQQRFG